MLTSHRVNGVTFAVLHIVPQGSVESIRSWGYETNTVYTTNGKPVSTDEARRRGRWQSRPHSDSTLSAQHDALLFVFLVASLRCVMRGAFAGAAKNETHVKPAIMNGIFPCFGILAEESFKMP